MKQLIDFAENSQHKIQNLVKAYDDQKTSIHRYKKEIESYVNIFKNKEIFLEDKNN